MIVQTDKNCCFNPLSSHAILRSIKCSFALRARRKLAIVTRLILLSLLNLSEIHLSNILMKYIAWDFFLMIDSSKLTYFLFGMRILHEMLHYFLVATGCRTTLIYFQCNVAIFNQKVMFKYNAGKNKLPS